MNKKIIEKVLKEQCIPEGYKGSFEKYIVEKALQLQEEELRKMEIIILTAQKKNYDDFFKKREKEIKKKIDERIRQLKKEKDASGKKKVGDVVYLHIYDMINELKELKNSIFGEENKK